MNLSGHKKGQVGMSEILKWILYLGIAGVVGFMILKIFHSFGG